MNASMEISKFAKYRMLGGKLKSRPDPASALTLVEYDRITFMPYGARIVIKYYQDDMELCSFDCEYPGMGNILTITDVRGEIPVVVHHD